jgi:hypothetical protein
MPCGTYPLWHPPLAQDLAPSVLVRMSDGDLASDSARAERAGIMDAAVRGAELVDSTMVHSGDVCPECSSVNTKVSLTYSMRVRVCMPARCETHRCVFMAT